MGGSVVAGTHSSSSGAGRYGVSVSENGRWISITEDDSGVTVTTLEAVRGKQEKTVVQAVNAQELEQKDPAAYRLYLQHVGGAADAPGQGQNRASEALGAQLRKQLKDNAGNPQMRELMEKMLRKLDEDN